MRRELGINPPTSLHDKNLNRKKIDAYLATNRSVSSAPTLSDPNFIIRLATGHDAFHLVDKNTLSTVVGRPINNSVNVPKARDIHLAIQQAQAERKKAAAVNSSAKRNKGNEINQPLRRSIRKRARSTSNQSENLLCIVNTGNESQTNEGNVPPESSELAPFRPSPESVRKTRSAAARARKSSTNRTPSECCFCPDPAVFDGKEIDSDLIGPFVDRKGNAKLFVHFDCACWAPQVYTDATGQLRRVFDEYCRGRQLKCSNCGEKGATIGCYIQRCNRVFHYRCLSQAGAFRVEKFFAAFCHNHSHLAQKPSYTILMEAATIADVAACRRDDSTFGLDAPHSRYTLLRRRETEVIFSSAWGICSHTGAYESAKVIFSHRRRTILRKTDKLSFGDGVRALRISAIDIASGRLACMALADKNESLDGVTAVEARAAIASRENTGLLLLRNLRRAPIWTKERITIVKAVASEKEGQGATSHKKNKEDGNDSAVSDVKSLAESTNSHDEEECRDKKRQRSEKHGLLEHDATNSMDRKDALPLPSLRLPCFTKNGQMVENVKIRQDEAHVERECEDPGGAEHSTAMKDSTTAPEVQNIPSVGCTGPSVDTLANVGEDVDKIPVKERNEDANDKAHKVQFPTPAASNQVVTDGLLQSNKSSSINGVNENVEEKKKTGWSLFLDEQLPKERLLRPDDPMPDSMRNMARLWSLMTVAQRDCYEQMANGLRIERNDGNKGALLKKKPTVKIGGGGGQSTSEAGLFVRNNMCVGKSQVSSKGKLNNKKNAVQRQPSVSLPRASMCRRDNGVDWDDLFPTALPNENNKNGDHTMQGIRVRKPPVRGKSDR